MRKVAAVLSVALFANSYAFGGLVEFSKGEFDPNNPGLVMLDVTISSNALYDFADVLFGSDDVEITDLIFSAEWLAAFSFQAPFAFNPLGVWSSELFSSSTNAGAVGPVLSMGQLVVDPTGLGLTKEDAGTQLLVFVDNKPVGFVLSQVGVAAATDPLFGIGIINVVPEPASIVLLGLAALALIRRRKAVV